MRNIILILFLSFFVLSCRYSEKKYLTHSTDLLEFDPKTLIIPKTGMKEIKGQVIYLPVYSNIRSHIDSTEFDMSAFVAIHNTDLYNEIIILKALYFNFQGKLVHDFLNQNAIRLGPLATKDFFVPYEDKSGTGANFIIEWKSDSLVTEPLIESVTISLKPNQSVAVLSQGRIIRELN